MQPRPQKQLWRLWRYERCLRIMKINDMNDPVNCSYPSPWIKDMFDWDLDWVRLGTPGPPRGDLRGNSDGNWHPNTMVRPLPQATSDWYVLMIFDVWFRKGVVFLSHSVSFCCKAGQPCRVDESYESWWKFPGAIAVAVPPLCAAACAAAGCSGAPSQGDVRKKRWMYNDVQHNYNIIIKYSYTL